MELGTKPTDRDYRKGVDSLPANYVSLAQLKEKWMMNKQEQEQREKEEQKVGARRKKRLGKGVQESENRYNRAKEDDGRRNVRSSHHWNRGNVSGTTFRVVRSPRLHPVVEQVPRDLKFVSSHGDDEELKPGLPNRRKGKEIYTDHQWNGNPVLEDSGRGNIKQSPVEVKLDERIASVASKAFKNRRDGVEDEINLSESVLKQTTMAVKEVLKISPDPVENDESTFIPSKQEEGKKIYVENRRDGKPKLEDHGNGGKKQSQEESKGDQATTSVDEICRNSNERNVDKEVKEVLKISISKIHHRKTWKGKKIYTKKHDTLNPKSEDCHNPKQSQAEGQGEKSIPLVAPESFENGREGVEYETGRNYDAPIVNNPLHKAIPQRFENLSMRGKGGRFFNRPKYEEPKQSKLVWTRKEDISSNDDLNGPYNSGNRKK